MMYATKCPNQSPTFNKKGDGLECDCLYRMGDAGTVGYCSRPEYYRCILDAQRMIIPISFSSANDFLTCHHLFYLKQIRGINVRKAHTSNALKMGALWDRAQAKLCGQDVDLNVVIGEYEIENREIAKVRALYRAAKELEIRVEEGFELQKRFDHAIRVYDEPLNVDTEVTVRGFYDRWYADHFVENKMSGRPDFYFDLFFIQSQIGTYFLADEKMEYVVMEVVRTPDLRQTGTKKDTESDEQYEERTFQDIISRPSHYFIGWNSEKRTYGKKFHRNEFNLNEVKERYRFVSREIHEAAACGGWYKNDRVCNAILPGIPCDMLGVCRYNTMSEGVYEIRKEVI